MRNIFKKTIRMFSLALMSFLMLPIKSFADGEAVVYQKNTDYSLNIFNPLTSQHFGWFISIVIIAVLAVLLFFMNRKIHIK